MVEPVDGNSRQRRVQFEYGKQTFELFQRDFIDLPASADQVVQVEAALHVLEKSPDGAAFDRQGRNRRRPVFAGVVGIRIPGVGLENFAGPGFGAKRIEQSLIGLEQVLAAPDIQAGIPLQVDGEYGHQRDQQQGSQQSHAFLPGFAADCRMLIHPGSPANG